MKTALKRVASLLMALIMILEVVAPGVVEARSANQNRATVSDDVFIPPDGNRIDPDQNAGSHLPDFIDPDDDGYYTPPQKKSSRSGQNAVDVKVSEEKAPKPLIEDEAENKEMALEFSREKQLARVKSPQGSDIKKKKFTILTRFDTSMQNGPIKSGQYFVIHLDDKLTVKDKESLHPLTHDGVEITAKPVYNETKNTITYKITTVIDENIQVPIEVQVDYDTKNIPEDAQSFTVVNSVSGLGVVNPKKLPPVVVDANGNMVSTILEPGRKDVVQIFDYDENYKVFVDAFGDPVIRDNEIKGIRWRIRVTSQSMTLGDLGFHANFTAVKGSGIREIKDVQINNKSIDLDTNDIKGQLGIVDSKHHEVTEKLNAIDYSFYTEVTNKQAAYMLDLSAFLKIKKKVGAVRLVLPQGYSQEAIREATPTRVGMNNRTTVMGEFSSADSATWTITDAICTDDANNGLPIKTRKLEGYQDFQKGKAASYKLNTETGKMDSGSEEHDIYDNLPAKETDPTNEQSVGTIAVYEVTTNLTNPDQSKKYSVAGVSISQCEDLYIYQEWGKPKDFKMPKQIIEVYDNEGTRLVQKKQDNSKTTKTSRVITVPGVKYWEIEGSGEDVKATRKDLKIKQVFDPNPENIDGKYYKYSEILNYYRTDKKDYFIHNDATQDVDKKTANILVLTVDKDVSTNTLPGAHYTLTRGGLKLEAVSDNEGKLTFSNVGPGRYTLMENKAPSGYKPESQKSIIVEGGKVTVEGDNVNVSGRATTPQINKHEKYPDYMNTMHYGKIDENGNAEFYLYLKPESDDGKDGTNRNTRLNISIPGVDITDVKAYDVSPDTGNYLSRTNVLDAMKGQKADTLVFRPEDNVINATHNNPITGRPNVTDDYTQKTGYQIYFPKERFDNDWGFLVKVKANVGTKSAVNLSYDWLTNEDTDHQAKLQQNLPLAKDGEDQKDAILTIPNEALQRQGVAVTKIYEKNGKKERLPGATFVIKDAEGNIIDSQRSKEGPNDERGRVNFENLPAGKYVVEEIKAPVGYLSRGVLFDVDVKEDGTVTYKARFKDGNGVPQPGQDYIIEEREVSGDTSLVKVTDVDQKLFIKENGSIGEKSGVWEAYKYESLDYHADITVNKSSPGTRFVIAFDRNLDLTQYVKEIPSIKNEAGVVIADPYMDYQTNRLTYVFNERSRGGVYTGTIDIVGIIPNKYYAKNDGKYSFTINVLPADANCKGNPKGEFGPFRADYGQYDQGHGSPVSQSYYFGDVYEKDRKHYVDAIAYYNPLGDPNLGRRTLEFSWASTDFGSGNIATWKAKGYEPAFKLNSVNIFRTSPVIKLFKDPEGNATFDKKVNLNMPLSFGVRPEQDPFTYQKVYSHSINPDGKERDSNGEFTLNYDHDQIQMENAQIRNKTPLKITMPPISRQREGYIIKQTFEITDPKAWRNKWRVFYMGNGTLLESAFAIRARAGAALGEQTSQELPKYSVQEVMLLNRSYDPGKFSIHKVDRLDKKGLKGAVFELTDVDKNVYRRSSDQGGNITFDNLPPGKYSLVETTAPGGYNASDKSWQVTVAIDGTVSIEEQSADGAGTTQTGKEIKLTVDNTPIGQEFRIFKKDADGKPLEGAKFTLTKYPEATGEVPLEGTSDGHGVVSFETIPPGIYTLEESGAPEGYAPLKKTWVVVVKDGKIKIYNQVDPGTRSTGNHMVYVTNTHWVDVKNRTAQAEWDTRDNRRTGYYNHSNEPNKLGTRIIAINTKDNYVIQRYVINPEGDSIVKSYPQIHCERPEYQNMYWYDEPGGKIEIQAYKLKENVTGPVEDIRLNDSNSEPIGELKKTTIPGKPGEPPRVRFELPATVKPIVVDVKIPYKYASSGVGTGMDLPIGDTTYWKSDYYERVSDIIEDEPTLNPDPGSGIIGSYLTKDSLDVSNDLIRYGFKLKKVKEDETTPIEGAAFKLTGPDDKKDEYRTVTGKDGVIEFENLAPGQYTLEETAPAPGYEKATKTWTITVKDDGSVYKKEANNAGMSHSPIFNEARSLPAKLFSGVGTFISEKAFGSFGADNETNAEENNTAWSEDKQSAPAAEAKVAKADDKKDVANTDTAKEANKHAAASQASAPLADQISRRAVLNNFLTTFGANGGLELGDEFVPSPVGAGGLEKVDQKRSDGPIRVSDIKPSANVDTKITRIDKSTNTFEQFFLYGDSGKGSKPREIQIYHVSGDDLRKDNNVPGQQAVIKVYSITGNSIDQPGTKTDVTSKVAISQDRPDNRFMRIIIKAIKSDVQSGNLLVEIQAKYKDDNTKVGLKTEYTSDTSATTYEKPNYQSKIAEYYNKEADINCKHTIKVIQSANGTIRADAISAKENEIVGLVASPKTGYHLAGFSVTDANGHDVPVNNNEFTMPNSDVTVRASFVPINTSYKISFFTTGGGTVPSEPVEAKAGETVDLSRFTATPIAGYEFVGWKVFDGSYKEISVTNNTFTMPSSDVTLRADFKEKQSYAVAVDTSIANGTVEVDKSSAKAGDTVTVTATPNPGFEVEKITYTNTTTNQTVTLTGNTFKMPAANVTVTASFKEKVTLYNVTVEQPTNGTVKVDKSTAKAGDTVTVTATPNPGFEVEKITYINATTHQTVTVTGNTFKMPDADVTLRATFKQATPAATYSVGLGEITGGGEIDVPQGKLAAGATVNLEIRPDQGKVLKEIVVTKANGDKINVNEMNNQVSFTMPNSDVTVKAVFGRATANIKLVTTAADPTIGGTVTPSSVRVAEGESFTLTAKPESGYKFEKFVFTDSSGKDIHVDEHAQPMGMRMANFLSGAANPVRATGADVSKTFTLPEGLQSDIKATAFFKPSSTEAGELITADTIITNKQIGLELKLFKKNLENVPLEKAEFILKKTNESYEDLENPEIQYTATSGSDGSIVFKDNGENVLLKPGYYLLEEKNAPKGYKQITAPWKIKIEEENGRLVAKYKGPETTPSDYLDENTAIANVETKGNQNIICSSRVTAIDPEAKTFVQRIYVDTRNFNGGASNPEDIVNVQINPVDKRDETDYVPDEEHGARSPTTKTQGVKTAYRTTYAIDMEKADPKLTVDDVLKSYDLSKRGVSMVNTARWRPFDWGFDEDQLNLKPGVYFIDVEGYYDDNIVDKGEIKIKFDFFDGKREFLQADGYANGQPTFNKKAEPSDSYQAGNANIAKARADGETWKNDPSPDGKYPNWLGKTGGKITPSIDTDPAVRKTTSINIKPLYTSDELKTISQDGLILENDKQGYNITFSKHGRDDAGQDITGKEVTENRLEGAIFKLQKEVGVGYEDVEGSYVSSAFNGYFGFRNLQPGRYRLMEVKAPEGYTPIKDPILYFTVAYTSKEKEVEGKDGVQIIKKGGYITLEYDNGAKGIYQYVDGNNKPLDSGGAPLVDFVTAGTAKNMGKIVNEKPGDGKVIITKKDENGKRLGGWKNTKDQLIGAQFKLTRLSAKKTEDGKPQGGVYYGTVGKDGELVFDKLIVGNYKLEEVDPHPGHINNGQVWYFTVGGEGTDGNQLDPYANDKFEGVEGTDRTKDIELLSSKMSILRPQGDDDSDGNVVRPHYGAGMEFTNEYKVKDDATINPGDYFYVKLSDGIDLNGIHTNKVGQLDIFADGVGTIAKAEYENGSDTIKYTFTNFAKLHTLKNFTSRLSTFVNLYKVKEPIMDPKTLKVGVGLDKDNLDMKEIQVDYKFITGEAPYKYNYEWWNGYNYETRTAVDHLNMSSKIVTFNKDTGHFTQYFYLNRKKKSMRASTFTYTPNTSVKDLKINAYQLKDNSEKKLNEDMPLSFGVKEAESNNLWHIRNNYYVRYSGYDVGPNNPAWIYVPDLDDKSSIIVKVEGTIPNIKDPKIKDKLHSYETDATIVEYNAYGYEIAHADRQDRVFIFQNENTAQAELSLVATNPTNRISVKKIDLNNNPLKDAEFSLFKKGNDGVYRGEGISITTKEDGLATFDKLASGDYQIRETGKPEGFVKLPEPVVEFKVDRGSGKIMRKVGKNESGQPIYVEENGTVPIRVVNHKPIQLEKKDAKDKDKDIFLPGAEFDVYYRNSEGKYEEYKVKGKDDKEETYHVKVGEDGELKGKVSLDLYKSGDYALKETVAPKGYAKPSGYVKEFRLEDNLFSVKEKGFQGNIPKEEGTTDKDTSFVMAKKVSDPGSDFYTYLVINPDHSERTYDIESKAELKFKNLDVQELTFTRINEYGTKVVSDSNVELDTQKPEKPIAVDLRTLLAGPNSANSVKSKDTIVLRLKAAPKAPKAEEGNTTTKVPKEIPITTVVTVPSGKNEAFYTIAPTKLEDKDKTFVEDFLNPREFKVSRPDDYDTNEKKKAEYDKAVAEYKAELETYYNKYRKEFYVKYESEDTPVEVLNYKGVYPFTGGFGPHRWIVIIGAVIAAVAAEEYIRRKRTSVPKGGA